MIPAATRALSERELPSCTFAGALDEKAQHTHLSAVLVAGDGKPGSAPQSVTLVCLTKDFEVVHEAAQRRPQSNHLFRGGAQKPTQLSR